MKRRARPKSSRSPSLPTLPTEVTKLNDGLYELHKPPYGVPPSVEIVFFHGLLHFGDYRRPFIDTWTSFDGYAPFCWPINFLAEDFPEARILSVCYDSSITEGNREGRIDLYCTAENLIQDLTGNTGKVAHIKDCPLILVGQDFGGLVIKAVCCEADKEQGSNSEFKSFLKNIKGIFYYCTPHLGLHTLPSEFTSDLATKLGVHNRDVARLNNEFRDLRQAERWKAKAVGSNYRGDQSQIEISEGSSRYDVDNYYTAREDIDSVCKPNQKNQIGYTYLHDMVFWARQTYILNTRTFGKPGEPPPPPLTLNHDTHEQLPSLRYIINDTPAWPEAIILGFQHYIVNLGTIVLFTNIIVPLMGGDNDEKARVVQTILFVSALNTIIQTSLGSRLPVIMGISFAYIIPILGIINSPSLATITDQRVRFRHTMRAIQGALIAASSIQIILGFSGLWGLFTRFLSPIAVAPTVLLTALGLYQYSFSQVAKSVGIGLPTIILTILFSQYLWHVRVKVWERFYHVFELFPILITVAIIWGYPYILTVSGAYDHAIPGRQQHSRDDAHSSGPWIRFVYPLEWGPPSFDAGNAFGMMAAVFVSTVESTAGFYAAYRVAGATPPPPGVISRGIGWGGVGVLLNGVYGTAAGVTVSIENIGLIGITRVGSRRVIQVSALWMAFASVFGKFGRLFAAIPVPIFAGFSCILFGIVAAVGISSLHFANMNKLRNLFVIGFALYMGFSVPFYFYQLTATAGYGPAQTDARWFNDIVNVFFGSGAVIAFIIASVLDQTVRLRQITPKDRGMHWFSRFHEFSKDSRNEEFYKLPHLLHRYLPPA